MVAGLCTSPYLFGSLYPANVFADNSFTRSTSVPPFGVPYVFRALLVMGNHAFGSYSRSKAKIKHRGPSMTS